MAQFLHNTIESILSKLKGRPFQLDRKMPLTVLLAITCRRAVWALRGVLTELIRHRRLNLVFMAPDVTLRSASLVRFGRGVTLERGVIIDGLSRDGMSFGDNVLLGPYTIVRASTVSHLGEGVTFGNNSSMDAFGYVGAAGWIRVGENVMMGQHVSFHAQNHNFARTDIPIKDQGVNEVGITIEDDCWVGANVTFLDGTRVGRGCVIGAGSVVRGEIPPYSIVVGVPGKVIRSRHDSGSKGASASSAPEQD